MKLSFAALLITAKVSRCELPSYADCAEISKTDGAVKMICRPDGKCKLKCDTANGYQRVGPPLVKCTGDIQEFLSRSLKPAPSCLRCNTLEANGLDVSQFDLSSAIKPTGKEKFLISCKNGYDIMPQEKEEERVECYCNKKRKKCSYRFASGVPGIPPLHEMGCRVVETTSDPIEWPIPPMGPDRVRLPYGLTCIPPKKTVVRPFQERIVGGVPAYENSWPWIIQLRYNQTKHSCAGTLISNRLALTPAHCCVRWPSIRHLVGIVGQHWLNKFDHAERAVKFIDLKSHWKYNSNSATQRSHDICMLRMTETLDFDGNGLMGRSAMGRGAAPVCLPDPKHSTPPPTGTVCWTAGWGRVSFKGKLSGVLMEVDIPIVDDAECDKVFGGEVTYNKHYMRCAGDLYTGKDSCWGDGGGPLICSENNKAVLRGITSFGHGCGNVDSPSVYVRIEHYMKWIRNLARKNKLDVHVLNNYT